MERFSHQWIRIESRVNHDSVDEIVNDSGNAVDATQSFIQRELFCWHANLLLNTGLV
jgi:hypothetical protein